MRRILRFRLGAPRHAVNFPWRDAGWRPSCTCKWYQRVRGTSGGTSSVGLFYGSITALPCTAAQHIYPPLRGRSFTVSQFFNHEEATAEGEEKEENVGERKKEKGGVGWEREGSQASAFIAENGIKARWKRAPVVFRGFRREDKENGCRSSRANLPLDPPSTK